MKKFRGFLCVLLAAVFTALAGMCIFKRAESFPMLTESTAMAAVALALPDGRYNTEKVSKSEQTLSSDKTEVSDSQSSSVSFFESTPVFSESASFYDGETHYPILEMQYSDGDSVYGDFSVKNSTGYEIDAEKLIEEPLAFDFEESDKVQVLIVHTHTSESYLTYDAGYYHESYYPRSQDNTRNMVRVGEEIAASLEAQGIGVVHATDMHDSPQYDGAYQRSYNTISRYLEEYPNIKVVLDIHRDSISRGSDGTKVKPTFSVDGEKAAQIMIMAGYDPTGSLDFPFWEENLSFALKLQQKAEEMYPGMTRPLYFGNFAYNMNVNNGSLLIEVGTDVNTLEEAVRTGGLLGNVLAEVLQSG